MTVAAPPEPEDRTWAQRYAVGAMGGLVLCLFLHHLVQAPSREPDFQLAAPKAPTGLLGALAFAHADAVADVLYLRAIQVLGAALDGSHPPPSREWLLAQMDGIRSFDPRFRAAYLVLARLAPALPSSGRADALATDPISRILEAGVVAFPNDWEMEFALASHQLFDDEGMAPDRHTQAKAGLEHLERAARAGGGPAWLPGLAAQRLRAAGRSEEAQRLLEQTAARARDDASRYEAQRLLLAPGSGAK